MVTIYILQLKKLSFYSVKKVDQDNILVHDRNCDNPYVLITTIFIFLQYYEIRKSFLKHNYLDLNEKTALF